MGSPFWNIFPFLALLCLIAASFFALLAFFRGRKITSLEKKQFASTDGNSKITVVRYHVNYQREAACAYQLEAQEMAQCGYRPAGQCWLPGSYDWSLFLVALFMSMFGVGLLVLIYMIATRPRGVLIVSYELCQPWQQMPNPS